MPVSPPVTPRPPLVTPVPPQPERKGNLVIPIIIALVIIIAIIAAGFFFALPLLTKAGQGITASGQHGTPAPTAVPATNAPAFDTIPATMPPVTQETIVPTTPSGPSYNSYSNSMFGFSIDYPSDWTVNELNSLQANSLTKYDVVQFVSPSMERCDTDRSVCEDVSAIMTVEVESSPGTNEVADYYVAETTRLLRDNGVEITKRDATYKLSGAKAYRFDYEDEVDKKDWKLISAYTIIDKKAYVLTYSAYTPRRGETDMFEKYYNEGDHMFTSFRA